MIPRSIKISGFLSYQEDVEIDFTSIHVACITGQNGAGKSAMLDAMTWALFGEARKNDESVIKRFDRIIEGGSDF
jgi:exonuclease SbcC